MIDSTTIEMLSGLAERLHKAGVFGAEVTSADKAFAVPTVLAGPELGGAKADAVKAVVADLTRANRTEVRQRDAGTYRCTGGNTLGKISAPAQLRVLSK